jgi:hypothetical protein
MGSARAAQERGFSSPLGLDAARGNRARLDYSRVGRTAARRIEQVVRGPTVAVEPAALADAARRGRPAAEREDVKDLVGEGTGDLNRPLQPTASAEPYVPSAVDRVARMAVEDARLAPPVLAL